MKKGKLTGGSGRLLIAGMLSILAALPARAEEVTRERIEEIIGESCVFCHGEKGEASNPIYPRLAHQNRDYLIKQLKNFRDGKRKSAIMNEQAAGLTDAEIRALADYFASQPPQAHPLPDDEQERLLHKVGEYVYKYGDGFDDIPPCATCHGKAAEGSRTLPRLAGQHRQYIVKQLKAFSKRERTNDNAIMHSIASRLSPLAMHGVALYLSTLMPRRNGK
jgi:cytochrome c553